jgi:hypothetical protein
VRFGFFHDCDGFLAKIYRLEKQTTYHINDNDF